MGDARTHSRFGGSKAARWLVCPGSVALTASLPDVQSVYAARGTVRHKLAELCLLNGGHPRQYIDQVIDPAHPDMPVDQSMCDDVVPYLNAVTHEQAQTQTSQLYVELKVEAVVGGEAVHSFLDGVVWHPATRRLRVFDPKFGYQPVDADDNAQLKFYALLLLLSHPDWRPAEIVLTIVQPNGRDVDATGAVKDWTFAAVEILEFLGDVEEAIAKAKAFERDGHGRNVFMPGPHCDKTFCTGKSSGQCPAIQAQALKNAGMDFEGVKPVPIEDIRPDMLPKPETLDMDKLAQIARGAEWLATWAAQCKEHFDALILNGATHPSVKIVETVGRAKWIDDPQKVVAYADMVFGLEADDLMPPKLITITEMEKKLRAAGASKDDIDAFKLKFTLKESTGRTVAPVTDRRPAVDPGADFVGVNVTAIAAE